MLGVAEKRFHSEQNLWLKGDLSDSEKASEHTDKAKGY